MASTEMQRKASLSNHSNRKFLIQAQAVALADDAGIDALLAAHAAASAEADAAADSIEQSPAYEAAAEKCRELYEAIMNARPTEPIAMAKQIRFLIVDSTDREDQMLAHIADQLEAMQLVAT